MNGVEVNMHSDNALLEADGSGRSLSEIAS